jgi:hypothetical protein
LISELRWEREGGKPRPELRVGDIYVGPDGIGSDRYILRLSGEPTYGVPACRWPYFPTRLEIVTAAREKRKQLKEAREQQLRWREEQTRRQAKIQACAPAPDAPDTLGWRGWRFDGEVLISPMQGTRWNDTTLRVDQWSDSDVVRGVAGIHARRLPRDWRQADPAVTDIGRCDVHGIVERFGRYVLGTEGWRAEWVVIRELMAPNTEIALALMRKYPDVRVHVREQEQSNEDR